MNVDLIQWASQGGWLANSTLAVTGVMALLVLWRLVRLYRATKTRLGTWTSKQWIMVAVSAIAIALTILSIHGIQAALDRIGITSWYGKLSAVIAFEMFLGLCAFLSYRERMSERDGSNPYGLMVWVLAGLMGAAGAWGGGSWLYATFPLLAAVAWEFALHAEATWQRTNLDTDKAKTWWASFKANWRAKLDLRNRRIKKLVAASLALEHGSDNAVRRAATRQQRHMAALMTAGDWDDTTQTEVKSRVRDLASAALVLSPAYLTADLTAATNAGTTTGTVGLAMRGTGPELAPETEAALDAELNTILAVANSSTGGTDSPNSTGTNTGTKSGTKSGTAAGTNRNKATKKNRNKVGTKRVDKAAAVRELWEQGMTDPAALYHAATAQGLEVSDRYVRKLAKKWNQ